MSFPLHMNKLHCHQWSQILNYEIRSPLVLYPHKYRTTDREELILGQQAYEVNEILDKYGAQNRQWHIETLPY